MKERTDRVTAGSLLLDPVDTLDTDDVPIYQLMPPQVPATWFDLEPEKEKSRTHFVAGGFTVARTTLNPPALMVLVVLMVFVALGTAGIVRYAGGGQPLPTPGASVPTPRTAAAAPSTTSTTSTTVRLASSAATPRPLSG